MAVPDGGLYDGEAGGWWLPVHPAQHGFPDRMVPVLVVDTGAHPSVDWTAIISDSVPDEDL